MALGILMLVLVAVSLVGVASIIFLFVLDNKEKNNAAFITASVICFASTFYNIKFLPESMNNAVVFAYIPAFLALVAILLKYILNKHQLMYKLLICFAMFIGILIAFIT